MVILACIYFYKKVFCENGCWCQSFCLKLRTSKLDILSNLVSRKKPTECPSLGLKLPLKQVLFKGTYEVGLMWRVLL